MLIYKHMTVEGGLRLLQAKTMRVTQPEALNDTLECRPALRGIADEHGLRELAPDMSATDRMVEEELSKVLARIPAEVRAQLPPHVDDEFLRNIVRSSEITETTQCLTLDIARTLGHVFGPLIHEKINEHVGVLSFTSRVDSASMWDRYSEGNRGVAIALEDTHEFFHPHPERPNSPMNLKPVHYVTARTSKYMVELDIDELFFLKTDDWAYEQELRMVRLIRDARAVGAKDQSGYEVFVVEVPVEAVRGMVYGLITRSDDRRSLAEVLKHESYAHVQQSEMQRIDSGARLAAVSLSE